MNRIDFLQGFLRSPLEVGSVIPSSRFMVNKVMNRVREVEPKSVVELGAGTGVFTRELDKHCGQASSFMVFEKDETMKKKLEDSFPHRSIYADALDLPNILQQQNHGKVDCIVCGLPFTLFPKAKTEEMFEKIYDSLADDGTFIMYQYTTHMKQRLQNLFGQVTTRYVLLNIPPTFVFFCKK